MDLETYSVWIHEDSTQGGVSTIAAEDTSSIPLFLFGFFVKQCQFLHAPSFDTSSTVSTKHLCICGDGVWSCVASAGCMCCKFLAAHPCQRRQNFGGSSSFCPCQRVIMTLTWIDNSLLIGFSNMFDILDHFTLEMGCRLRSWSIMEALRTAGVPTLPGLDSLTEVFFRGSTTVQRMGRLRWCQPAWLVMRRWRMILWIFVGFSMGFPFVYRIDGCCWAERNAWFGCKVVEFLIQRGCNVTIGDKVLWLDEAWWSRLFFWEYIIKLGIFGSFGLTGWIQTIGCLNVDGSLGGRNLMRILMYHMVEPVPSRQWFFLFHKSFETSHFVLWWSARWWKCWWNIQVRRSCILVAACTSRDLSWIDMD